MRFSNPGTIAVSLALTREVFEETEIKYLTKTTQE